MLKRIKARNFLSLKDIDLELRSRNVFVGANMSGKSNLIQCFRFLQEAVSHPTQNDTTSLQQAFSKRGGFGELVWKGQLHGPISFEITVDLQQPGGRGKESYNYAVSFRRSQYGYPEVASEKLTLEKADASETILENATGKLRILHAGKISESVPAPSGLSLELQGPSPSFDGFRFWNFMASWRFYHLVPALMRQSNSPSWEKYLSEHGENLSSWLLTLQNRPEEFDRIKQACRDVLPGLAEILFQPVESPKTPMTIGTNTYVTTSESSKISVGVSESHFRTPISINRMSDGELAFLGLMSLILAPDELSAPVLCIEEPENYLHPQLLEILVELLDQRQKEVLAPQIIATTHSPLLVDKLNLDDLIVTEREEGATKFTRASSKKHFQELLSKKKASLGDLWYSGALTAS
jgi:predicted ATPase